MRFFPETRFSSALPEDTGIISFPSNGAKPSGGSVESSVSYVYFHVYLVINNSVSPWRNDDII